MYKIVSYNNETILAEGNSIDSVIENYNEYMASCGEQTITENDLNKWNTSGKINLIFE